MSPEAAPRVSVVIVSYNSAATLPRCLDSLAAQTYKNFHLILVDNASAERPDRLLAGAAFPVSCLEMQENLGFAEAMNRGLAAADGPYLAALNPDAFPHPDWLAELVTAAGRDRQTAAFGSLQVKANDPSRIDGFGDHYLIWGIAWRGQRRPGTRQDLAYCFGVCAAAALYRVEALRAIGGFDRRFFCFYEDVDVAFRLRLMGHGCAVVPTAVVDHIGGASFAGKSGLAEYLMARNQWWVLIKNMPAPLLPVALLGYAALQLVSAITHPNPHRRRGLREALARTGEFLESRHVTQSTRRVSATALIGWLSWSLGAFLRKESPVKWRL